MSDIHNQREIENLQAENERLRAEVKTWINHTKNAVWSDSEECKLLTAENEKLRAAFEGIADRMGEDPLLKLLIERYAPAIARAALEGKHD